MNHLPELPLLLADVPAALRQALAQEGVPAAGLRSGRAGKFVLFDSLRGRPTLADGQVAIDVHPLRTRSTSTGGWGRPSGFAGGRLDNRDGYPTRAASESRFGQWALSRQCPGGDESGASLSGRGEMDGIVECGQLLPPPPFFNVATSNDPLAALADESAACQEWQIGGLAVRETVARVQRASTRHHLLARLREKIEAAGGLWLRVSPYPGSYRSAFNFRFDHDECDREDFDATLAAIAGYEHAISHYVCAATHVMHSEALHRLRGCHVGSHGWWHHTYREAADNLANIGRGIEALRAAGIEPVGFAAPHGRFNAGLLAALAELGVTHSSEFALAYDDLPFFPRESDVLQIPVHPICLGVCLEAARRSGAPSPFVPRKGVLSRSERQYWRRALPRLSDDAAADILIEHWQQIALQKHAAGEPMFFYGHPDGRLGRHPRVLKDLLAHISGLDDVWWATLADFEQWWRQRAAIEITALRIDDAVQISSLGLPAKHRVRLDYCRGNQVAQIELDRPRQLVDAEALYWQPRSEPRISEFVPVEKPLGLRAWLHGFLDWERVTPIDEISVRTWRGRAKKTLRRVKG